MIPADCQVDNLALLPISIALANKTTNLLKEVQIEKISTHMRRGEKKLVPEKTKSRL